MEHLANYAAEVVFGLISTVLTAAFVQLNRKIKKRMERHDALEVGMQAILRDRLIQSYNHYVVDKTYAPIYAKENVTNMYEAYHALGGNGAITKMYGEFMDLPTEPEVETP